MHSLLYQSSDASKSFFSFFFNWTNYKSKLQSRRTIVKLNSVTRRSVTSVNDARGPGDQRKRCMTRLRKTWSPIGRIGRRWFQGVLWLVEPIINQGGSIFSDSHFLLFSFLFLIRDFFQLTILLPMQSHEQKKKKKKKNANINNFLQGRKILLLTFASHRFIRRCIDVKFKGSRCPVTINFTIFHLFNSDSILHDTTVVTKF